MDKEAVGKGMGPFAYTTWERKIRQFIEATGDKNPLYIDEEFAKKSKYGGLIAPLAMANAYFVAMAWSVVDLCKIDRSRLVHGEQEYEFIKPIKHGTLLSMYFKIIDIYEKKGMSFAVVEGVVKDESGDIAVKGKLTMVEMR